MTQREADRTEPDVGTSDGVTDDATPVGDTPELHDKLSPHDLPPGHPSRDEVARRADADEAARATD